MKLRVLRVKKSTQRLVTVSFLLLLSLLLTTSREPTALESVLARGEIKMITRMSPLTYYQDGKGANGFEYILASKFAKHLGVKLTVNTTDTLARLFNMLGGPNADFAAASITITPKRQQWLDFTDSYATVSEVIIYQRGTRRPRTIADLAGKNLVVIGNSSHEERLLELQQQHPDLHWSAIDNVEMVELIEMVHHREIDFAIVDSTSFNAHKSMYPMAKIAFPISEPQQLAWAFRTSNDASLVDAANRFFHELNESDFLEQLKAEFFSGVKNFTVAGAQVFAERMRNTLPQYEESFRHIAQEAGMDWHLLAAMAYQESHWNPKAVSPTGVKGMMMLTRPTAREVGIKNRLDPEQSLRGGAMYFLAIKSRLADDITEPDRTWFALAAYNVGMGHLQDARVLTERHGKDPHLWRDVREHLPLLQRHKYFSSVRHGYARGGEPVLYVKNIRKYVQMLQWNTIEKNRRIKRELKSEKKEAPSWDTRSFLTL